VGRARRKLAIACAKGQKIIRLLFALSIRTDFASRGAIVSDKAFKSFGFNLLPVSGI
jgi:hypothetical protein